MTNWVLVPVPEQDCDEVTALVVKNQTSRNERPWPSPADISADDIVADAVWRAAVAEHPVWRKGALAQLSEGASLTAQRWTIAMDFCAVHPDERFSTEEIVANTELTLNEWRDACRKITPHLRANYQDKIPTWARGPYDGAGVWPLVTVAGRDLETDNQLYVGMTLKQATNWREIRGL